MSRWREDDGTISGMVAVFAIALLACAGLAYDGGAIIQSHSAARDVAGAAARAGAQQVALSALHEGRSDLDPVAAEQAALDFIDAAGMTGSVSVAGSTVTVTVQTSHRMRLLPLGDRSIVATASATAVSDVLGAGP